MRPSRIVAFLPLVSGFLLACGTPAEVPPPKQPEPTLTGNEAPPERRPEWCTIVIESSPPGLEALLNGKPVGKTPTTVDKLPPGNYDVTIKDEASGDVTMAVELGEGEYRTVKHNVVPRADRDAPANAKH